MAKRHQLTELKVSRVALVDRGANQHAHVMLFKAADGDDFRNGQAAIEDGLMRRIKAEDALAPEVAAYLKRDFTSEQRDHAADSGTAMPDGSFPIENRADLKNAVRAIGRAKNPAKAKAHIISRAKALDATSLLPDGWKVSKLNLLKSVDIEEAMEVFVDVVGPYLEEMGAADFDEVQALCEAREYANGLLCEIDEAVCSLRTVFWEINDDPRVSDKAKALQESLEQFKAHIQGIIPEGLENALVAQALVEAGFTITEGGALTKRETDEMGSTIELKKSLGLAATASEADVQKAIDIVKGGAQFALNVLKLSGAHLAYMASHPDMTNEVAKQDFAAKSESDRDAVIKAKPMPKSKDEEEAEKAAKAKKDKEDEMAADEAKKRLQAGDEVLKIGGTEIRKSVVGDQQFAVMKAQQDEIAKLQDKDAVSEITKRVTTSLAHIGKADELATLLHGIRKLGGKGPELADAVEKKFGQLEEVIAKDGGKLFTEVGKGGNGLTGSAADAITKLAEAKVAKGDAKNIYKAKDMVRRENADLAKQEETERKAKAA